LDLDLAPSAADMVVLTPYLTAEASGKQKSVNVGDGFILRAMERLLGLRFPRSSLISPRAPLDALSSRTVAEANTVLIAGANQLNDRYTILPGLTVEQLRAWHGRVVPFAIGIHGRPEYSSGMSDETREILREVHRRIRYSSWRCPLTIDYLRRQIPEIRDQLLMTGCVVIYDEPLLTGLQFSRAADSIAVTATERDDFWMRESTTLRVVADKFPRAARYFVVHQDQAGKLRWRDTAKSVFNRTPDKRVLARKLRRYARSLGYEVVVPSDADAAVPFYIEIDMHFGSRLHAHLLFLSRAKRSFLTYVDERAAGMAQAYDFPLCDPDRLVEHLDFDFELVRRAARHHYATMQRFISSVREELDSPNAIRPQTAGR
jgi:hypothetical protein